MRFGTLNTILNNAPLIIQGATRLIKMIKERDKTNIESNKGETNKEMPDTLKSLGIEIEKLSSKLDANSAADVEQIELIEQLAMQNEALAESLKQVLRRQRIVALVAASALIASIIALVNIFQ
ncbi:MAG: hypothetical protein IIA99_00050 [Proteobacteria bacterium]|nr:hypothetical protein [Pseudomonadota bacterium]